MQYIIAYILFDCFILCFAIVRLKKNKNRQKNSGLLRVRKVNELVISRTEYFVLCIYKSICNVGIMNVLVAMRRILARTDGQNAELWSVGAHLSRAHLDIMKHPVAFLCEESHIHREALRCAVTFVVQRLLCLYEVLHAQQSSRQEISCYNIQRYLD